MTNRLPSEQVIISAPTSFSGSAQRIWKLTYIDNNPWIKLLLLIPVSLILIFTAWMIVAIWYLIIFGLFGIFVIPFRLFTRSSRNRKAEILRHREVIEAIQNTKR